MFKFTSGKLHFEIVTSTISKFKLANTLVPIPNTDHSHSEQDGTILKLKKTIVSDLPNLTNKIAISCVLNLGNQNLFLAILHIERWTYAKSHMLITKM